MNYNYYNGSDIYKKKEKFMEMILIRKKIWIIVNYMINLWVVNVMMTADMGIYANVIANVNAMISTNVIQSGMTINVSGTTTANTQILVTFFILYAVMESAQFQEWTI